MHNHRAVGFEVVAEVPADQGPPLIGHQEWTIFRWHIFHARGFTGQLAHFADSRGFQHAAKALSNAPACELPAALPGRSRMEVQACGSAGYNVSRTVRRRSRTKLM
ncbi:MAG: hypothetical protein KAX78_12315 [Phycisphaerae bacterium]|nr:hypothetical protein [Phycisphaerae bacterium]